MGLFGGGYTTLLHYSVEATIATCVGLQRRAALYKITKTPQRGGSLFARRRPACLCPGDVAEEQAASGGGILHGPVIWALRLDTQRMKDGLISGGLENSYWEREMGGGGCSTTWIHLLPKTACALRCISTSMLQCAKTPDVLSRRISAFEWRLVFRSSGGSGESWRTPCQVLGGELKRGVTFHRCEVEASRTKCILSTFREQELHWWHYVAMMFWRRWEKLESFASKSVCNPSVQGGIRPKIELQAFLKRLCSVHFTHSFTIMKPQL